MHIFGIGGLSHRGTSYVYIDMQRCDFSLSEFNLWNSKTIKAVLAPEIESFFARTSMWNIMKQVANGLTFIHAQKEIHRGLTLRNCIFPPSLRR
jgi:serine/threonine protein kinase